MKFPEIKRAAELDHYSAGWPSLSESGTRPVRSACCRIAILLTLVATIFPIFGAKVLFEGYPGHSPIKLYAEILGAQLLAPVFLLLLEGLIGYCTFFQKRIPLWVLLMVKMEMTKGIRRTLGLLFILACWLGLLSLFEII